MGHSLTVSAGMSLNALDVLELWVMMIMQCLRFFSKSNDLSPPKHSLMFIHLLSLSFPGVRARVGIEAESSS